MVPSLTQTRPGLTDAFLKPDDDEEAAAEWTESLRCPRSFFTSMLWTDTVASAKRFVWSMLLLIPAVMLGLHMGMFPVFGQFFLRFILFFDKIIALSVLPILFIAFGIDELAKIMLIVIGVTPTIILDTFNLTKSVPPEAGREGLHAGRAGFRRCLQHRAETDPAARAEQHPAESESRSCCSFSRAR